MAIRVLQAIGDVVPSRWFVGGDHAFFARLDAEGHTQVSDVSHWAGFFSHELGQRLS